MDNGFISKSTDSLNKLKSKRTLTEVSHTDLLVLSDLFSDSRYKPHNEKC